MSKGYYRELHPSVIIGNNSDIHGWVFIGENTKIGECFHCANFVEINSDCKIGNNVNFQTFVLLNSGTKIGNGCMLAAYVKTADEKYLSPNTSEIKRTPCKLGNNVFVGINSTLVCCKIGSNSIIGANSLVLEDVPPNEVWIGSPAKRMMSRKEYDEKQKRYQMK